MKAYQNLLLVTLESGGGFPAFFWRGFEIGRKKAMSRPHRPVGGDRA